MNERERKGNGCLITLGEYLFGTGTFVAVVSLIAGIVDSKLSNAVWLGEVSGAVGAVVGAVTWFAGSRININADSW